MERKRAHPNMVLVRDLSQKSSSIVDLLEVGGKLASALPFFFLAELRS
jgi:hypothetical protein